MRGSVGYFYQEIGDKLLIGAQQTLSKYGIDEKNVDIFYAPGAFEIPLLAKKLAKSGKYHGIVTLGAVIVICIKFKIHYFLPVIYSTTSKPKPFKAFSFLGLPKIRIFPTPKSDNAKSLHVNDALAYISKERSGVFLLIRPHEASSDVKTVFNS
jgi:hypothetical protein